MAQHSSCKNENYFLPLPTAELGRAAEEPLAAPALAPFLAATMLCAHDAGLSLCSLQLCCNMVWPHCMLQAELVLSAALVVVGVQLLGAACCQGTCRCCSSRCARCAPWSDKHELCMLKRCTPCPWQRQAWPPRARAPAWP